ncbi:MAG: hypothetical protein IJ786_04255 [Bacteroidaceae bacterium]|nr:hypothetical protein [Bacteroidaceae bacterium]
MPRVLNAAPPQAGQRAARIEHRIVKLRERRRKKAHTAHPKRSYARQLAC